MDECIFYVGSFANSFHICKLDREKEEIISLCQVEHLKPAHLVISKNRKHLYITSEMFGEPGQVAVYDISNPLTPVLISTVSSGTQGACFIQLTNDEKFLVGGSYFEGNIEVYPVQEDGSLGECCYEYQSTATGIAYPAGTFGQAEPRIHCVMTVKDTSFILAADYSGDRLINFEIDNSGVLHKKAELQFPKGDAPRQLAADPKQNDVLYMVTEFTSQIYSIKVDRCTGEMTVLDSIPALKEEKAAISASIRVAPDGEFLYVSNRKNKNISVISLEENGKMAYVGALPDAGYVRDAQVDPSGKFLVVGNMEKNEIVLYRRNEKNGMCALRANRISIQAPVYFAFL